MMNALFSPGLESVFFWILMASWQASVLAMFVLLIQKIFATRLNPRWRYALWLLVLLRLILPALPESVLSLFQFTPPPPSHARADRHGTSLRPRKCRARPHHI